MTSADSTEQALEQEQLAAAAAEDTIPPLGRDRRVQAWVVSGGISQAGDAAWLIGLAWTSAQIGGAHGAAIVMGIGTLPRALLTVFGGALADRLDARRTMVWSNIGRIAVLLAAIAVMETTEVTIAMLVAIQIIFGGVDALYRPASSTMPRQLVRGEDLGGVSAMFQLANRLAGFVGAPLGGVLIAIGGLRLVALADAVSFVFISLLLAFVLKPRLPRRLSSGHSIRADIAAGLRYIVQTKPVRTLVIALSGLNLFISPVLAVGVVLRVHDEGWSSTSLGLIEATVAISAAAASAAAVPWRPARPARVGLLMLVIQSAAMVVIGWAPLAGMFVGAAMVGVTAGLASALLSGAFMRTVAEDYLGRTSSIQALGDDAVMPLAMVGFGALAAGTTVGLACTLMAVGFATLVTWSAFRPGLDSA
ncbi:MAG TPA: MFS transporter [Nocardioidaceae bacterium]|nr:MFS transporter [Nocardioidaceae bacterium]